MDISDLTAGDKNSFEKDPQRYIEGQISYTQRFKDQLEKNLAALLKDYEHYKKKAEPSTGYLALAREILTSPFLIIALPAAKLKSRRYSRQRDAYSVLAFKAKRLEEFFSSLEPKPEACISLANDIHDLCCRLANQSTDACLAVEDAVRGRYPHFFRGD